jgi:hypothetical protein
MDARRKNWGTEEYCNTYESLKQRKIKEPLPVP